MRCRRVHPSAANAPTEPPIPKHQTRARRSRRDLLALSVGALGVVYGDIGTSPLYAIKECVNGPHAVAPTPDNVLGILSLVFLALVLVVAVKYLVFILRVDNDGEGGILALLALVLSRGPGQPSRRLSGLLMLGLFGAGLLIGDGVITPAITVLGAMEGLQLRAEALAPLVVPLTASILVGLFLVQRFGTGGIGRVFGPITLVWFISIAVTGTVAIARHPQVLAAVSPHHAVRFMAEHGGHGFFLLGSVVLVITGAEALYADMGHFGRTPIRTAWFTVVMPALLINYFGQGAAVLADPAAAANPFYALAPGWTTYPMVMIATAAAIVASQALISGLFSITRQAVQLGYLPRLRILHTSAKEKGQIYIASVNYMLMIACVLVVLGFRSSSAMASAYAIAVTGTMAITSLLFFYVAQTRLGWTKLRAGALVAVFLAIDLAFFTANLNKVGAGGWLPLALGAAVLVIMTTWRDGRTELGAAMARQTLPLQSFLDDIGASQPHRVRGTAVFMTSNPDGAPVALLHHFKHSRVLHEQVVLLSIVTDRRPKVRAQDALEFNALDHGFYRVIARVGFMQAADVVETLERCSGKGLDTDPATTTFYLGRETLLTTGRSPLSRWRKVLFGFLSRNARAPTDFFGLPPNRVVELGIQIEL